MGERLRAIRKERGLTISQLAAATGLTSGFISQLERDLSSASLSSLARICAALDVRFGDVMDEEPRGSVVRREEASTWAAVGPHRDLLLSPRSEHRFHLIESRVPPGKGAGEQLYSFPADVELVYVVSGTLELRVGDRVLTAGPGETITYSPRDAHTWRNPSESEEAVVLWFAIPNPFLPAKPPRG